MKTEFILADIDAFYGIDLHQDTLTISRCTTFGEPEYVTTLAYNLDKIRQFFVQELQTYPKAMSTYEAGGCGVEVHRLLCSIGVDNVIAVPSLLPKKKRKRKNDILDSKALASYLRNGEIHEVYVHDEEDEACRELNRLRLAAKKKQRIAQQQLLGFLRRHGKRYPGKTNWTKTYWKWLWSVAMPSPALQYVLLHLIEAVEYEQSVIEKLEDELRQSNDSWVRKEVVEALMTLKGIDFITAFAFGSEIGSFLRFSSATEFMAYLGLMPSEHSSGERVTPSRVLTHKVQRGHITKEGNIRMRSLMVEASHAYRHRPKKSPELLKRWEGVPSVITDHAWKAQHYLNSLHHRFTLRGKHTNVIRVAIARKLAGFVWHIACLAEAKILTQQSTHAA
jgi:transposase